MVILILLACENNPLILILSISFDTYNLFLWRLVKSLVLESIIHTVAWSQCCPQEEYNSMLRMSVFLLWGCTALSELYSLLFSVLPLRQASYEIFILSHIDSLITHLLYLNIVGST
jgi:ferric-chelate reductase